MSVIRPYIEADLEAVIGVWAESWDSTAVLEPDPNLRGELRARLPAAMAAGSHVYVAVADSQVVGFMAFKGDKLEKLFIAPTAQGRGVGRQLLDFAKHHMSSGFYLNTPAASRATRFYEREGLTRGEISTHSRLGYLSVRYEWRP